MLKNKKILAAGILTDIIIMSIVCIFNVVLKISSYSAVTDHIESIELYNAYIIGHMYVFFFMVIMTVIFNIMQYSRYKKTRPETNAASDKKYISDNILVSFIVFIIWVVIYGIIVFF